jgi:hypothetical protein
LAAASAGDGGTAVTTPLAEDQWLMDNTPLEVQVDELSRQVVAARGELAALRRDFSHWWAWADQEAAPIVRYLRGKPYYGQTPSPPTGTRLEALNELLDTQQRLLSSLVQWHDELREKLDALALVVNGRLDHLEAAVGELDKGEDRLGERVDILWAQYVKAEREGLFPRGPDEPFRQRGETP